MTIDSNPSHDQSPEHTAHEPPWRLPIPPLAAALAITIAIFLLYLYLGTGSTLFDRDEPRFSRAAVEMVRTGDFLVPMFDGNLRPDKPILIYWLMSISIHALGVSTLAVRLPSMIATALACLLCYAIGKRLYGPRTGLLAMAMLALSPLMMLDGAAAISDPLLLLTLTASFAIFIFRLSMGLTMPWAILMGITLGLGQLAKGPVALAVVLGGCAMITYLMRPTALRAEAEARGMENPPSQGVWVRRQVIGLAVVLLISVVIFLAWAIPANAATGGDLAREGLGRHVGERMIQPQEGHGGANLPAYLAFLPFYVVVVLAGFAPWMIFLIPAWRHLRATRQSHPGYAVLLGWFLPTFILMTLVVTKLPHYVLPTWPALAIACSAVLIRWFHAPEINRSVARFVHQLSRITTPAALLACIGLVVVTWGGARQGWFDQGQDRWSAILADLAMSITALAWVLAMLCFGAWLLIRIQRLLSAAMLMILGMTTVMILLGGWLLPTLERHKPAPQLAATANQPQYRHLPIATFRYDEPSLRFYADRPDPIESLPNEEALTDWLTAEVPGLLVIDRENLMPAILRLRGRANEPEILQMVSGFTTRSANRYAHLLLVKRSPQPPEPPESNPPPEPDTPPEPDPQP
ncbi:MAG: glycosyltransferase family 39 protein [Phycisphaeraceae bacterium]|nr:glycosyltransferase family 39 protein [Phycisphaeraceae bacterium]